MDERAMRTRVATARVGRLATADVKGVPHVVPFCFVLDGDTLYSAVDQKPKSTQALKRLDNVRANPRAAVVVDHYEDDWSQLWWVRLAGRARVVEDALERGRALELLTRKYEQYREHPPEGAVLAVDVDSWSGWTGT